MTDKFSGTIVAERDLLQCGVDAEDASSSSTVDELLHSSSGALLEAHLTESGTIAWLPAPDATIASLRVLARSQMGSMLRDAERNAAFASAISAAVESCRASCGRPPRVLDIGAGTGLLGLLAARAGAGRVVSVEQWPAMASVAAAVVAANGGGVEVLAGHSSGVAPGAAGAPVDLVVSEIVDSGLLGEGILPALRDAFSRLGPAAAGVPSRARIMAQLCSGDAAWLGGAGGAPPELRPGQPYGRVDWAPACAADVPAFPVHAWRAPLAPVSAPFEALRVGFSAAEAAARAAVAGPAGEGGGGGAVEAEEVHRVPSTAAGAPANCVLWWWELVLWEGGGGGGGPVVMLSTSPHHDGAPGGGAAGPFPRRPTQDHWVQMVSPLCAPAAPDGGGFTVVAARTALRVAFCAGPSGAEVWPSKRARALALRARGLPPSAPPPPLFTEPQPCVCGLHRLCSVERLWALRCGAFQRRLRGAVDAAVGAAAADAGAGPVRVLDFGQGAVAGLLALGSPSAGRGGVAVTAAPHGPQWDAHVEAVGAAVAAAASAGDAGGAAPRGLAIAPADAPLGCGPYHVLACDPRHHAPAFAHAPLWSLSALWRRFGALLLLQATPAGGAQTRRARTVPARATLWLQAARIPLLASAAGPAPPAVEGFLHAPFNDAVRGGAWAGEGPVHIPLWQYECEARGCAVPALVAAFSGAGGQLPGWEGELPGAGADAQAVVAWVEWDLGGEEGGGNGGDSGWCNEPAPQRAAVVYLEEAAQGEQGVRAKIAWDEARGCLALRAARCG